MVCVCVCVVVPQFYQTEVNNEHVIRGNSAILKCVIPSFVADFVSVASWSSDDGETYRPSQAYGKKKKKRIEKKCIIRPMVKDVIIVLLFTEEFRHIFFFY